MEQANGGKQIIPSRIRRLDNKLRLFGYLLRSFARSRGSINDKQVVKRNLRKRLVCRFIGLHRDDRFNTFVQAAAMPFDASSLLCVEIGDFDGQATLGRLSR